MNYDSDVLIAGGGLNGPALGLALARSGLRVCVIDAAPPRARATDVFDGRAYALAIASQKLLAAVGVWPAASPNAARRASTPTASTTSGAAPAGRVSTVRPCGSSRITVPSHALASSASIADRPPVTAVRVSLGWAWAVAS